MKPSGNESLHRPGHKMVCGRNFSAALFLTEAPKIRVMTSQSHASMSFLGTT